MKKYTEDRKKRLLSGDTRDLRKTESPFKKHGGVPAARSGCLCSDCSATRDRLEKEKIERAEARREAAHGTPNGYSYYGCRCDQCKKAHNTRKTEWRNKKNPSEAPHGTLNGYVNYGCRCDPCKEAGAERNKEYQEKNPLYYLSKYDIKADEYTKILAFQGGVCAICKRTQEEAHPGGKRLCLDHNHKTGAARGVLCTPCNTQLGFVENGKQQGTPEQLVYLQSNEMIISALRFKP